jgi:hypothetical protein
MRDAIRTVLLDRMARNVARKWAAQTADLPKLHKDVQALMQAYDEICNDIMAEGYDENNRYIRQRVRGAMERVWVPLVVASRKFAEGVMAQKAIPPGKAKKFEMAARVPMSARKMPVKPVGWWYKNERAFKILIEAINYPDAKIGGDALFKTGPFKVHNTVGLEGKKLDQIKKLINQASRNVRKLPFPKIKDILYGDIYIVGKLQQARTMAWWHPGEDAVYVRPFLKFGEGEVHSLVHEWGHRYWRKFMPKAAKNAWLQHHRTMTYADPDVTLPDVGDELPVKFSKKQKDLPIIKAMRGGMYWFDLKLPTGEVREMSYPIHKIMEFFQKRERQMAFPTAYAATDPEEHFCEALGMMANGKLKADHEQALKAAFGLT